MKLMLCHRDLNVEYILLDENYNPKITGFYFCCINANNLHETAERNEYKAPEVLSNHPYNGIRADIFSLGQFIFILVAGLPGFNFASSEDISYKLIINEHLDYYWEKLESMINLKLSQEFKDLFIRMAAPNSAQRPTIEQILHDAWMQEINYLNQEQMNALENEVRNEFQSREAQIPNHHRIY